MNSLILALHLACCCLLTRAQHATVGTLLPTIETLMEHVVISDRPVVTNLGSLLQSHNFLVPESALRKGTVYIGSNHRLRRVVHDMLHGGHRVQIVSISTTPRMDNDWISQLNDWTSKAFRNVSVASSSTQWGQPTGFMTSCFEPIMEAHADADLVLSSFLSADALDDGVEFNGQTMATERLVQKVLGLPKRPAMVLVQHPGPWAPTLDPSSPAFKFHQTLEDAAGAVAQFYDVQWLSFRSTVARLVKTKQAADLLQMKPTELIQRVLTDLLIWLIQQTAIDLLIRPFNQVGGMRTQHTAVVAAALE